MKKILVLIDMKREPEHLSLPALKIASQLNADIILAELRYEISPVLVSHDAHGFFDEQSALPDIQELAEILREKKIAHKDFKPAIQCENLSPVHSLCLNEFVVKNNIMMIIQAMPLATKKTMELSRDPVIALTDHINCPCLFLPGDFEFSMIDKIGYYTDLRYCDINVIRFLRAFNAFVYVTHLSASGLPDIEKNYAHEILSDDIAAKSNYKKLFLRNIKRGNHMEDIERVIEMDEIKMNVIVGRKHRLLEELLSTKSDTDEPFFKLPLLILPFLNWHSCTD